MSMVFHLERTKVNALLKEPTPFTFLRD